MKLVVLAILVAIVLSTSSFDSDHEIGTSMEIPDSTPRGVLKKNGTAKTKSGHRVRFNSTCKWSEFNLQPFGEITNSSLRTFLQTKIGGIASTDCILFYRMENNDDESSYYLFRIDRQTRFSRPSLYGIVGVDDGGNFTWNRSYRKKFEHYLAWCDSKDGAEDEHPQVPRNLSCRQTRIIPTALPPGIIPTIPAKWIIPPLKETTTPAPPVTLFQEVASTTLSTRAIHTQKITPTTFSPIPPRGVTTEKSAITTRKGWRDTFKSLNCFSCVE